MRLEPTKYAPQLPPRDYQQTGLDKMRDRPAFALLMAMRTGKTKTLLDDFGRLELDGKCQDLLVIAPAGVYRTWVGQANAHLSIDLLNRVKIHVWETGPTKTEIKALENFIRDVTFPRIFLVNVEALSAKKTGARYYCEKFLLNDQRRAMIAVDESTIIKSHKAIRTKYINGTLSRRAAYRRILSGLPTPRSPLDIYCQFEFLDPAILGHASYYSFQRRYAITRLTDFGGTLKRKIEIVVGYQDADEIARLIEPHSFRVEFRPQIPSTYSIREVSLTEDQIRIYDELKEFATARIGEESHVTATIVIVQMLRLHQVLCGHVRDELGNIKEIPENRTSELLDLLNEYSGKAVIWCSYDEDVKKISIALEREFGDLSKSTTEDFKVTARFWGGNLATREKEEVRFKTDPQCRFMIATPAAGGRGRTWDVADLVVYYSSTNNLEHRDQSEQRVQGVDKKRQVDYVDLIVKGTVEEKIISALRDKIDMATLINGDNYREWLI